MTTKAGKSYEYNAICDVCGFKKKNYELFKRWDGFMVCKEDWETRNLADFYDTPNDTHILPWTRPDQGSGLTWTPSGIGIGTWTRTGFYTLQDKVVDYQMIFTRPTSDTDFNFTFPLSRQISLPLFVVTDLGNVNMDSNRVIYRNGAFPLPGTTAVEFSGNIVLFVPGKSPPYSYIISGSYITT